MYLQYWCVFSILVAVVVVVVAVFLVRVTGLLDHRVTFKAPPSSRSKEYSSKIKSNYLEPANSVVVCFPSRALLKFNCQCDDTGAGWGLQVRPILL